MEKETWINEVMNSTKGLAALEANPFLFEKALSKIEANKKEFSAIKILAKNWAWAAVLVVVVNLVSFTHILKQKPNINELGYAALSKEMGLQQPSLNY